ncbi:MAG: 2-C-methyl-D-erythritol 2,4-cyclodiphosphate synthase [Candidatus Subteraquimicrobiales bacterium]|nr:2-C-methyl-D-erythritol 2,4-cyclodiphosphate synthase [Candidatus Subteraquimicrobiales bacterium]
MRVGIGFDAHKLVEGRPLILGGIEIPYPLGLAGHSDADVIIHAVIDAILGAIGAGDIGYYFPDTDSRYKGISSLTLLLEVAEIVVKAGFTVVNVDVVAVLEEPKLSPYREKMCQKVAEALKIKAKQVSIKAKTTEGLGFSGRREGIAAYAVALVEEIKSGG